MHLSKIISLILLCLAVMAGRAQAGPFDVKVQVEPIRYMSLQHNQTIKTFDTYARETLYNITGKTSINGRLATYSVLDMAFDPAKYASQNLIYIRNKPFRQDIIEMPMLTETDRKRILEEGTLSLDFWLRDDVQQAMGKIVSTAVVKQDAVRQISNQASTLAQLLDYPKYSGMLRSQAIVPPPSAKDANEKPWQTLADASVELLSHGDADLPPNYAKSIARMVGAIQPLAAAWRAQDADAVNQYLSDLASAAADANPAIYPSTTKRHFEVRYNSLFRLTLPAAFFYFIGFVFFLLAWRSEVRWMYVAAVVFTLIAWSVHVTGIGIRWWLVEKSVGNWFESIPIKNQFESMLMSAVLGVTAALGLEAWKRLGIFGAAAAFIGMLSLTGLFAAPFVSSTDSVRGEITQNAGILMTYWLYIHVVLVTCSYALIGMTMVMGIWYLVQSAANRDAVVLRTLDQCNLVMLQLAFWVLGLGIITGAMWADVSWGRPWGWDPKETFALITWIVYLIIIHVRFVTSGSNRAAMTSVLSVVGFLVMIFNWFGVNFFLVGLHSYA
jgi:ABC-type transport system involved in cytochrome c biogenesis permease subunit